MINHHPELHLNDFTFNELFSSTGLKRLDQSFLDYLYNYSPSLHDKLIQYRQEHNVFSDVETSELLIACSIQLEQFIANLFAIEEPLAISCARTTSHNPISTFKKYFVLRRAKKELNHVEKFPSFDALNDWLNRELATAQMKANDKELAIALLAAQYLATPETYSSEIEKLVAWCARAMTSADGIEMTTNWVSFHIPKRLHYDNLITTSKDQTQRIIATDNMQLRDGFKLTDERMNARQVQDEVHYCIYCHDHDGDFCSKGFPVKKNDPTQGLKKNSLDVTLTGCPLEEKISEMNLLKRDGHTIASLAMVMIDNPMCPVTGHRICNDCMKACIYQKQEPVNIPQIETRVLTDVLDLPWGVEIYDLLTRFNPLRQTQWIMKPYNGLKILIAGMGPAGFTLAHHLLLEGCAVVGFDGLKIESLPKELIEKPIHRFTDLKESLDERVIAGFGGVAEYGITARWDKNFLKLIYISLMRRPHFQVFGGVRFGGTLTVQDAWQMGFDHFAVAVGAGLPKALKIPGSLATGMRQANDFLMTLQLGKAAKASSLTNLQVRMPVVVIGGGLTGVDTATEVQAYYIAQVEKILTRYEILVKEYGEETIQQQLDASSQKILNEYLQHGALIRHEREQAKLNNRLPNFIKLIHDWGGVTIVYRKTMQASPAYINNHEELQHALREGIFYVEDLEPIAANLDEYGHVEALVCRNRLLNEEITLAAHSILVATGTKPNTAYEFEHRGTFNRLSLHYQHYEDHVGELNIANDVIHCKDPQFGPFTSYNINDKRISLIGDTHPVFHGSVVKAIASGMRTYPKILENLQSKLNKLGDTNEYDRFAEHMNYLFQARVDKIERKTKNIIELTIQAPLAAKHYQPGQFYRLQNFETCAPHIGNTLLQMEPLAVVTAECDQHQGTLNFIVQENTSTAKLCSLIRPGELVSLMGPTGVRAKIPMEHETVLIVGNQSSFAFLRSYGKQLREEGNHVIYLGRFASKQDVYCQTQLENAADSIIWLTKDGTMNTHRRNDYAVIGDDIVHALTYYENQTSMLSLKDVDRIFVVGDSDLLRSFQNARNSTLKKYLIKHPKVYGSVYGNMQCMLKGVCAQCLQWQIDPETGERTKAVFSCSWQNQPLELIDIDHIDARQSQNKLHEQLSQLWLDYIFNHFDVDRV